MTAYHFLAYLLIIIGGWTYFAVGLPLRGIAIAATFIPTALIVYRIVEVRSFIDVKLAGAVDELGHHQTYTRTMPRYRLVDLYRAAEKWARDQGFEHWTSQHDASLTSIVTGKGMIETDRKMRNPPMTSHPVGVGEHAFIPARNVSTILRHLPVEFSDDPAASPPCRG